MILVLKFVKHPVLLSEIQQSKKVDPKVAWTIFCRFLGATSQGWMKKFVASPNNNISKFSIYQYIGREYMNI